MSETVKIDWPADIGLRVTTRAYPGGRKPFDHDWLLADLIVRSPSPANPVDSPDNGTDGPSVAGNSSVTGFRCSAFLRAEAFQRLARALATPEPAVVRFTPTEPYLEVELDRATGRCAITARDVGTERVVRREAICDRATIDRLTAQVADVVAAYPPRGAIV